VFDDEMLKMLTDEDVCNIMNGILLAAFSFLPFSPSPSIYLAVAPLIEKRKVSSCKAR
jgi:hypothetical protein